jgi:uncharacterized membrane protein
LSQYIPRLLELGIIAQGVEGRYALSNVSLPVSVETGKNQEVEQDNENDTNDANIETSLKQDMKQVSENETSLNENWNAVLNKAELKKLLPILDFMQKHGDVSPSEIQEALGKSRTTTWRYLALLCERHIIETTGSTSAVTYRLKAQGKLAPSDLSDALSDIETGCPA